ncbi:peptidoglycan editing factor PgeF [Hwanghaeella grinnelliae]|uniref:Purine nucleoside phosphorylase n=1 Tax=Hwanghaeella grinnelliae TaxID=2500179 RepID=A0A3S2VNM9_9PROT|nr:peptidoglycan editing factor PgeF [Hwanghaeella grinnelliae]RVU37953.1 peptidoglycan editing factor PgeF [Hwanghaeella grinnelliae]
MTDETPTPIIASDLAALRGVRHGFFTRKGGVSGGLYASLNIGLGSDDEKSAVVENRRRTMAALDLPEAALTTVYQVHGATAVPATKPWLHADAPKADGIVSNSPGVALGIATADCAPVLFADEKAGVIGACHAGWKGAHGGITDATIAAMETLGAHRTDIIAVVGPCIAQKSYEVGAEFRDSFLDLDSVYDRYFVPGVRQDKYQFDLPGFVISKLENAGIALARWLGRDTKAEEDEFFSYRRTTLNGEKDYGRLLSTIALAD